MSKSSATTFETLLESDRPATSVPPTQDDDDEQFDNLINFGEAPVRVFEESSRRSEFAAGEFRLFCYIMQSFSLSSFFFGFVFLSLVLSKSFLSEDGKKQEKNNNHESVRDCLTDIAVTAWTWPDSGPRSIKTLGQGQSQDSRLRSVSRQWTNINHKTMDQDHSQNSGSRSILSGNGDLVQSVRLSV